MELSDFWITSDGLAVEDNELSVGGVGKASAPILYSMPTIDAWSASGPSPALHP